MPLIEVPFTPAAAPLPPATERLLADADTRIDDLRRRDPEGLGSFVPADYAWVHAGLAAVRGGRLAPGSNFLEWGSGVGVAACLAATLGFDSAGIEAQAALVEEAEDLAASHGLAVAFAHGSFIPPEHDGLADVADDLATLATGLADGHDALGLDPSDAALVYAYPWPGEEAVVEAVFEAAAATGALLLTYRSTGDLVLQRKR
ncbi:hypothetical protein [Phycisphaera mikurensis]|uniref:Methyltransferase n=1 Tax=Phycisphaera mikurensis (strain NBRC 102666 / KCTC 22515 / FYK2301M01) TaxID=1142394 RepID=I0IIW3_PHYMF|nr:hypothetical protein [Phycisphaera mikurensis]MBB6443366.1 hypothetical protein [Phycisphaera mikurensis]BAM05201.1 hypothetical protein PSMK_30420 [Phycisphaera mikurensis NBRC 102666]